MGADQSRPDRARSQEVFACNADIFSLSKYDLARTNMTQHDIPLIAGAHLIKQRPYRHGACPGNGNRKTSTGAQGPRADLREQGKRRTVAGAFALIIGG